LSENTDNNNVLNPLKHPINFYKTCHNAPYRVSTEHINALQECVAVTSRHSSDCSLDDTHGQTATQTLL